MTSEWYYTTDKRKMGPVSWAELRELADAGIVKPSDLVWTDGMDEWVKARQQRGLLKNSAAAESSYAATKPPPARRARNRDDDDDEEEDEEDEEAARKAKKKARRRDEERAKMAVGVKIALIVGGVVLVLAILGCAGVALFFLVRSNANGGLVHQRYAVVNLIPGRQDERQFRFTQGRRVVITVTNNLANPNTDVDLLIFRGNQAGVAPLFGDVRVPFQTPNCRVEFIVPATDTYRVRVVNLGPGIANSCNVVIDEQ